MLLLLPEVKVMARKLLSRAEFAALAGVSGAAITKAAAASLEPAKHGKYIDAAHPAAVEYLANKAPPAATGLDPLYEDAIKICRRDGKWTANHIKKTMSVGSARATRIAAMIKAAEVKSAPVPKREAQIDEAIEKKTPHVRGTAARKARMKAAYNP